MDATKMRNRAEQGEKKAQYSYGLRWMTSAFLFINAEERQKTLAIAFKWFKASAKQGHEPAYHEVAMFYEHGYGMTSCNQSRRNKWMRRSLGLPASNEPVYPSQTTVESPVL